jgi:hypothetical protein
VTDLETEPEGKTDVNESKKRENQDDVGTVDKIVDHFRRQGVH